MVKWRWCTNVRADCLATLLNLNKKGAYETAIPAARDCWHTTGNDPKPQAGHNDCAMWNTSLSGSFFIFSRPDAASSSCEKTSHHFFFYLDSYNWKLAEILKTDTATPPPFSFSIGGLYVRNAGAKCVGYANLWYHVYLLVQRTAQKWCQFTVK